MSVNYKKFEVLALDVDGVLTDGTIAFEPDTNREIKSFNVHDGQGISIWLQNGGHVVLISGRNSEIVAHRARELNIQYVFQGSKDKVKDLKNALDQIGCGIKETIFVGDDVGDLAVMQEVGYAIAVQDACEEVQQHSHWITPRKGGHGAVRDAIEHIMKNAGKWDSAIQNIKMEQQAQ